MPALKEGLISSEEGVARVLGVAGDTKGEVCFLSQELFTLPSATTGSQKHLYHLPLSQRPVRILVPGNSREN